MADLGTTDVASLIQGGGVLVFALVVWLEQRGMRRTLDAIREMLSSFHGEVIGVVRERSTPVEVPIVNHRGYRPPTRGQ